MKKFINSASAFVILTAISSPAFAGDIYSKGSTKDGEMQIFQPTEGTVNWTGFYVGVQGGYGNANHNLTVNEYFKDYCSDSTLSASFDPFGNGDRSKTLKNRQAKAEGTEISVLNSLFNPAGDLDGDGIDGDTINTNETETTEDDTIIPGDGNRQFIAAPANPAAWTDCQSVTPSYNSERYRPVNNGAGDLGSPTVPGYTPGAPTTGGNLSTVAGDSREWANIDGLNSSGFVGGGRLGYDRAFGRFLIGAYGEYNFASMETTATLAGFGGIGIEKEDEWTVGLRAGYIVAPRTLAYILAGYTQTEYSVTGLDNPALASFFDKRSGGASFSGITVGGGLEFALMQNVFFGLEYAHTFYGEEKLADLYSSKANFGLGINDELDEDKVMGTLKIKLNGFGQ